MRCTLLTQTRSGAAARAAACPMLLFFLTLAHARSHAPADSLPFLSNVFSSHAVLPRERPLLWGFAPAGALVTVSVGAVSRNTTAFGAPPTWRALLPDGLIGEGPFRIVVTGSHGARAELTDVLLGVVLLCSGQSNVSFDAHHAHPKNHDPPKQP